jgi:MinD-like ATPase involved in chromosome partitioning or flagellar assembly
MPDQAAGLRKLAGRDGLQVISILAGHGGAGKTIAATNLASALSRAGRLVKVVDTPCNDLSVQYAASLDLNDAVPDVVLVDTPSRGLDPCSWIEQTEIVIVLVPDAQSIKAGYGLLKQLHSQYGIGSFHVVLNQVTDSAAGAAIACNFSAAAGRFLGVSVHYLGHIPHDPQIERAARLKKSVVEAFPIAESARQFRQMADKLVSLPRFSNLSELGDAMQRIVMSAAC